MQKILIIAADPRGDLKKLRREIDDLRKLIERSESQDQFKVESVLASRSQELQDLFLHHKPSIVHFCGHGDGEKGLVFEDEAGQEQVVGKQTIVKLFQLSARDINCAVFNACNTDALAKAIAQHLDYAIGMQQEILDEAAHLFTCGFYLGLGYGESIERSYERGCLAIEMHLSKSEVSRKFEPIDLIAPTLPEHLKPMLHKRVSSDRPSVRLSAEFAAAIAQESDRKQYQDQARASWDSVGRSQPPPSQSLTQHEYRQRRVFVGKVKEFWIEGFLKRSLVGEAIELGLQACPDAVQRPFADIPAELDQSFEQLRGMSLFEQIGQGKTLLILGEPGAGKTIALLKLAERLVEQTDLSQPMPVVLNLASWASRRQPIAAWLVEELREKYQVPKVLSKPWIEQEQLILLLDGLDEVKAEYRNDCVRSLNQFIETHSVTDLVVCSRIRDYEALSERLKLSSAICLQPLTAEQVDRFLAASESLAGLQSLIQQDPELEEFAQTPLILNIMSSAYADWSIESLTQQFSVSENRYEHLFDTYIDRMLGRRGMAVQYSPAQTIRWLSWLAQQMVRSSQTIFLIEWIDRHWLQTPRQQWFYIVLSSLLVGFGFGWLNTLLIRSRQDWLMAGLTLWSIYSLAHLLTTWSMMVVEQMQPSPRQIFLQRFVGSLVTGVLTGLLFGMIAGVAETAKVGWLVAVLTGLVVSVMDWGMGGDIGMSFLKPVEALRWSWANIRKHLMFGIVGSAPLGLILGLTGVLDRNLVKGLFLVVLGGGVFGLLSGLRSGAEVETRMMPNQGIWRSEKTSAITAIIISIGFSLVIYLLRQWLTFSPNWGIFYGLFVGLLMGGTACLVHISLRTVFYWHGYMPWNYSRFLDFASDRLLLKKVGGGYLFYHRMLMEHLARQ